MISLYFFIFSKRMSIKVYILPYLWAIIDLYYRLSSGLGTLLLRNKWPCVLKKDFSLYFIPFDVESNFRWFFPIHFDSNFKKKKIFFSVAVMYSHANLKLPRGLFLNMTSRHYMLNRSFFNMFSIPQFFLLLMRCFY